jgi:hypothetical protein
MYGNTYALSSSDIIILGYTMVVLHVSRCIEPRYNRVSAFAWRANANNVRLEKFGTQINKL